MVVEIDASDCPDERKMRESLFKMDSHMGGGFSKFPSWDYKPGIVILHLEISENFSGWVESNRKELLLDINSEVFKSCSNLFKYSGLNLQVATLNQIQILESLARHLSWTDSQASWILIVGTLSVLSSIDYSSYTAS